LYPAPAKISGFYYARERNDDKTPPTYISKICKTIQSQNDGCCLVLHLKNSLLKKSDYTCLTGTIDGLPVNLTTSETLQLMNEMFNSFLDGNLHRKLVDIEDHMDNAVGDIKNCFIDSAIVQYKS